MSANDQPAALPTIGVAGALSIGLGGIVGGGFFATYGLTIVGAKGGTPLAFVIGGLIAIFTAYSYIGLTVRYPGPGGTATFIRQAFGSGLLPASVNVLLTLSYIGVMGVYAMALAAYSVPYLPEASRALATQLIASLAIVVLGLVNFMGASLMTRLEALFNIGKLGVLTVFIIAGLVIGQFEWDRFALSEWAPASTIVASGMLGFLAYEGFELIANASGSIRDRERTLPIAFLGCVAAAIVIYVLAFIVGIGHLSFAAVEAAQGFAISAVAASFLGPAGFAIMSVGAVLASASAINADYFGASKLPVTLSRESELPSAFQRSIHGKSVVSLATIGVLALLATNILDLQSLSAATSGGFLIVFAAVNIAAVKLAPETGTRRLIPLLAAILCVLALFVMVAEFLADPATVVSGAAVGFMIALAVMIECAYRAASLLKRGRP